MPDLQDKLSGAMARSEWDAYCDDIVNDLENWLRDCWNSTESSYLVNVGAPGKVKIFIERSGSILSPLFA